MSYLHGSFRFFILHPDFKRTSKSFITSHVLNTILVFFFLSMICIFNENYRLIKEKKSSFYLYTPFFSLGIHFVVLAQISFNKMRLFLKLRKETGQNKWNIFVNCPLFAFALQLFWLKLSLFHFFFPDTKLVYQSGHIILCIRIIF